MCSCMCMCVQMFVEVIGQPQVWFFRSCLYTLVFETGSLSGTRDSRIRLDA